MKMFNNPKYDYIICWKFEDIFFASLTMIEIQTKFNI